MHELSSTKQSSSVLSSSFLFSGLISRAMLTGSTTQTDASFLSIFHAGDNLQMTLFDSGKLPYSGQQDRRWQFGDSRLPFSSFLEVDVHPFVA
jgi:hypothetical protein